MQNDFKLSESISITELNPYNCALKNEYIDRILTLGMIVASNVPEAKILSCFISEKKLRDENAKGFDLSHGIGRAITFTWEEFTESSAIVLANRLVNQYECTVEINVNTSIVRLVYKTKKNKIILISNNSVNIIKY